MPPQFTPAGATDDGPANVDDCLCDKAVRDADGDRRCAVGLICVWNSCRSSMGSVSSRMTRKRVAGAVFTNVVSDAVVENAVGIADEVDSDSTVGKGDARFSDRGDGADGRELRGDVRVDACMVCPSSIASIWNEVPNVVAFKDAGPLRTLATLTFVAPMPCTECRGAAAVDALLTDPHSVTAMLANEP